MLALCIIMCYSENYVNNAIYIPTIFLGTEKINNPNEIQYGEMPLKN